MNAGNCCVICSEGVFSQLLVTRQEINDLLKSLIVNINTKVFQNTLLCEACLLKIKAAYMFKKLYLENLDKVSADIILQEETGPEMLICDICKDVTKQCDCIPLSRSMKELWNKLLDIKTTKTIQTCEKCYKSLLNYYIITSLVNTFVQNQHCREDVPVQIDNESIKKEFMQSKAANSNESTEKKSPNVKKEIITEHENFQCINEELDMKTDYSKKQGVEQIWECDKKKVMDSGLLNEASIIVIPTKTGDIRMFQCKRCDFIMKSERNMEKHLLFNKTCGDLKKCYHCNYSTKTKGSLVKHMLIHRVEIFKCKMCKFQTKYMNSLRAHVFWIHGCLKEIRSLKCQECGFVCRSKYHHTLHTLIHKSKCKDNSKSHKLVSENNEGEMLQCDICLFVTEDEDDLLAHKLVHEHHSELRVFKCCKCQFTTKYQRVLKHHKLTH